MSSNSDAATIHGADALISDVFAGVPDSPLCPIRWMLDRIGSRWALYILATVADRGPTRFSDFPEALPVEISNRMLAKTLDDLVGDGLLLRHAEGRQVAYELSELGASLMTPMRSLLRWVVENARQLDESRRKFGLPPLDLPPGALS